MTIKTILGLLLSTVFLALATMHVYWAAGGESGSVAAVPSVDGRPLFHPSRVATLLVAASLAVAAGVVAGAVGWSGTPGRARVFRLLTFAISIVFLARTVGDFHYVGFFKTVVGSRFGYWDSVVYSPLCLAIASVAFLIARWTR